jgi:hypothetical protein
MAGRVTGSTRSRMTQITFATKTDVQGACRRVPKVKPRRPEWLAAWLEWERKRSCHLPCADIVRNDRLQCYFANISIRPLPRGSDLPIDLRSPISVMGVLNEPLGDPMMSNVAPMLRWGLAAPSIAQERCLFWMAMPVCLQVVPCALNKSSSRLAGSTAIVSIPWRCSGVFRTVRTGMQAEPSWVAASVPRTILPRSEPKCARR